MSSDYIWIDAICIDQGNLNERSSQVSLMGDIYFTAVKVIVWLGEDITDVQDFIELHEKLVPWAVSAAYKAAQTPGAVFSTSPWDPELLEVLGVGLDRWKSLWMAYARFYLTRRWFYRAWIVQEFGAARKIEMVCGSFQLPLFYMEEMSRFLRWSGWRLTLLLRLHLKLHNRPLGGIISRLMIFTISANFEDDVDGPANQVGNSIKAVFTSVSGARTPVEHWFCHLGWLAYKVSLLFATDPRDKLYSILGLANKCIPTGMERPIVVSYDRPSEEVYTFIAGRIIENMPFLTNLSFVNEPVDTRSSSLPSWVPDYSYSFERPKPLVALGFADTDSSTGASSPGGLFNASLASTAVPSFRRIAGSRLEVDGVCFDTIVEVSKELRHLQAHSLRSALELFANLDDPIGLPGAIPKSEVLWRTLIADFADGPQPPSPKLNKSFHDFVLQTIVVAWMLRKEPEFTIGNTLERIHSRFPSSRGILPTSLEVKQRVVITLGSMDRLLASNTASLEPSANEGIFARAASVSLSNRALYRTSKGYLGLGPTGARKGDEIWLICGALVPFIMRMGDDTVKLVGETYMHGFMHGEMLTPDLRNRISRIIIT